MALAYLLSPTFEIVNSAGKPATGGYIETYVAGSRTKYLCASDFDGTRHPFRIPLDSLGSNVVLADDSGSYDVYVYNRYGTLLMSRYNVHPGEGGGLGGGTITSSDGSIIVTPTANGNDLKVNVGEPSVLRAGADTIYSSGPFVFSELVREGDKVWVDNSGKIRCRVGWYHYDITVRITWAPESPRNETIPVQLYTTLASNLTDFDASYTHDNTIRLSGETKIVENGDELAFGVIGLRNGLGAELIDMGVHAICIGTAGQSDLSAGTGIVIDQGEISVDPTYMSGYTTQAEFTYGLAGKQDVIPDLSTIRSGAQAGSTAVQPSDLATVATTGDYDDLSDKPDLSVYATTSAMTTALAGKQDVISDLAQIRAGAAYGSSAVQPADLANVATTGDYDDLNNRPNLTVYATKTEVNTGLAAKQDVISDLATIRSGAAAGSTAVQPADLDTYATDAELTAGLATKQDVLTPGDNITISNNVISATDQRQADWAQSDSSAVDYIRNRPDLSVYATGAELTAGLATKQDTINDLSTIRSGAAAGATALQASDVATVATTGDYDDLTDKPSIPTATSDLTNDSGFITSADVPVKDVQVNSVSVVNAQGTAEIDLSGYATTQALTSGLAGKQDTISDLATIRSGAAAGASAVQPGDLATVATTGDYDDLSNKPSIPTVDQTYNASSTNAQSGVAVARAIASVPGVSYTAGDAIDITNNEISVDYDSNTLELGSQQPVTHTYNVGTYNTGAINMTYGEVPADIRSVLTQETVTVHIPANTFYTYYIGAGQNATLLFKANNNDYPQNVNVAYCPTPLTYTFEQATNKYWLDEQDVTVTTLTGSASARNYFTFGFKGEYVMNDVWTTDGLVNPVVFRYTSAAGMGSLTVKNPLPASSASDANKVLTVDAQGVAGWATPTPGGVTDVEVDGTSVVSGGVASITMPTVDQTYNASSANAQSGVAIAGALATKQDTISDLAAIRSGAAEGATAVQPGDLATVATTGSYDDLSDKPTVPTAGNMLSVTNSVLDVTTTAGITDVQVVNALPAQPVASVVYLIPET